jgi:hypothetical protein
MTQQQQEYAMVWHIRTNGLPFYKKAFPLNKLPVGDGGKTEFALSAYDSCRMVALSFLIVEWPCLSTSQIVSRGMVVLDPKGEFRVTNTQFHGISETMIRERGLGFEEAAEVLLRVLRQVTTLVSHNMSFDEGVFQSECLRHARPFGEDLWTEFQSKLLVDTKWEYQLSTKEEEKATLVPLAAQKPGKQLTLQELVQHCKIQNTSNLSKEELIWKCIQALARSEETLAKP